MPEYNEVLASLRKKSGLSQQELADRLGMTRSAISMYETGQREPDLKTFEIFADFFNVDMNTLTGHNTISEDKQKEEIDRLTRAIKRNQAKLEAYLKSAHNLVDNARNFMGLPPQEHKIISSKDDDYLDCLAESLEELDKVLDQALLFYKKNDSQEERELFLKRFNSIFQQFEEACSEIDMTEDT